MKKKHVFKAANIELIHTNGSYEFPYQLPDDSEFTEIPNVIPIEQTKYLCEVLLIGEWTYADWKGKRWFLSPGDYEASNTQAIWYVMVRDEWNEVLKNNTFHDDNEEKKGAKVRGILEKTNNKKLLNQWLSTTKSPVEEPCDYEVINLKTETDEFSIEIKGVERLITARDYLTRNLVTDFLNNPNSELLIPGKTKSWENWVIEFIEDIQRDIDKYYLTKLTKIESDLTNSWTLSIDEDNSRLGDTKEEGFLIPELDFFNITSILPISTFKSKFNDLTDRRALPNTKAGLEVRKEQSIIKPKIIQKGKSKFSWDLVGKNVSNEFINDIPRGTLVKGGNLTNAIYRVTYDEKNVLHLALVNDVEKLEESWKVALSDPDKKSQIDVQLRKIDEILAYKAQETRKLEDPKLVAWLNEKYPKWSILDLNNRLPSKLDKNGAESFDYDEIYKRYLNVNIEIDPIYGYTFCFEDPRQPEKPWMWNPYQYGTIDYSTWWQVASPVLTGVAGALIFFPPLAPFALPVAVGAGTLTVGGTVENIAIRSVSNEISKYLITFKNWSGGEFYALWKNSIYSVPLVSEIQKIKDIVFSSGINYVSPIQIDSLINAQYIASGFMDRRKYMYYPDELSNWQHSLTDYVYWIGEKEELMRGTHLFKLEGTKPEMYLIIHNGKPGIIFKDKKVVKEKQYTVPKNSLQDSKLRNLTLTQKIHQKAYLHIYNKVYPLKGKLTEFSKIDLSIKTITDPTKTTGYETYSVHWKSDVETILETIQVPKETVNMPDVVSGLMYESNLIRQQRNTEYYDMMHKRYEIKTNWEDFYYRLGVSQKAISFASRALGMAIAKNPRGLFYPRFLEEDEIDTSETPLIPEVMRDGAWVSSDPYSFWGMRDNIEKKLRNMDISGFFSGRTGNLYQTYQEGEFNWIAKAHSRFNKFMRSKQGGLLMQGLDLYKTIGARSYVLQNRALTWFWLANEHHKREWDLKREIDNVGVVHRSAAFRDLESTRKFNASIGADDIHIKIFYPSPEQLRILDVYEKESGITLKANVSLDINEDIRGVWRFSKIDYISVEDPVTKNFLKAVLLNGIRIVPRNGIGGQYITAVQDHEIEERIEDLERKIFLCNAYLRDRINIATKAAEERVEENVKRIDGNLQKTKLDLLNAQNELNKCNDNLIRLEEEKKHLQKENKKIEILEKEKAEYEKEKERCEEYIKEAKDDIRKLRKDYEYKAEQLRNMLKERNKFAEDIVTKDDEIERYKKQNKELSDKLDQATDLAEQIAAQKKQIEEQAKELARQKAEIEKQLEIEKKKQVPDAKTIKDYEDQLEEIKRKEKEAKDKLRQLEEELKAHETCKGKLRHTIACLEKYKEEYKSLYQKFNWTGEYLWICLSAIETLISRVNAIVKEFAKNSWSNSKSWNWTIKWLIGEWFANLFKNLADAEITTNDVAKPFRSITADSLEAAITKLDRFFNWWINERPVLTNHYGSNFSSERVKTVGEWITVGQWFSQVRKQDTDQEVPVFFLGVDGLNRNYPAYKSIDFVAANLGLLIKKFAPKDVSDKRAWIFENMPKWTIIKPQKLEECIDLNIQPCEPAAPIIVPVPEEKKEPLNVKETEEYKELQKQFETQKEINKLLATIGEEQEKKIKLCEEMGKKAQEQENELNELKRTYETCNNNLERYRKDYAELEQEKNQQQNLAALYKAESDKLKTEKVEALKARDDARAELLTTKEYYKSNPLQDIPANSEAKKHGAIGVGVNFYNLLKNAHNLKYSIDAVISDYKNRTRSNKQNVANLGYYLNYLMDDIVRTMRPYIGEKETSFAYSKKIPNNRLQNIVQ